jgi:hypothetical protein
MARPVVLRILVDGAGQPLRRCTCTVQPCIYPMHYSNVASTFRSAADARNMKRRMLRKVRKYFAPSASLSTIHIIRLENQ